MAALVSKEHYEMIEMFEKVFGKGFRLDKEPKELWAKGNVYQHGDLNNMFLVFRHGYAYGKAMAQ
jgi:hypothetical protein